MPYFHVIGKLNYSDEARVLFSDLSQEDLKRDFIKPYERGSTFFSGSELIDSRTITQIRIIETPRVEALEREEINRADLKSIDEMNRQSSGVVLLSLGAGYEPEDIAEAGEDVSRQFIKGAPGFKRGFASHITPMFGWMAGIISAVIASGISKWLGWI